jgi:hypothetical protein
LFTSIFFSFIKASPASAAVVVAIVAAVVLGETAGAEVVVGETSDRLFFAATACETTFMNEGVIDDRRLIGGEPGCAGDGMVLGLVTVSPPTIADK